jgi:hypothetical protein
MDDHCSDAENDNLQGNQQAAAPLARPSHVYTKQTVYNHMNAHKFKEGTATHLGLDPTKGKWTVAGYRTDAEQRAKFLNEIADCGKKGIKFAITESITALPEDALTRLRFDVDLDLRTNETRALYITIPNFIETLWTVLKQHTNISGNSRICILQKPAPTQKPNGLYRHGFKVVCCDVACTLQDMLALRTLMNDQFEKWGNVEWLNGVDVHQTDIIDPCIYTSNGWLYYGSTKAQQTAGGYTVAEIFCNDALESDDLSDYSHRDLVYMQSIYHTDEMTEQLLWNDKRPQIKGQTAAGAKRKAATQKATAADNGTKGFIRQEFAFVKQCYSEHGGELELQEKVDEHGVYWLELSPGPNGRKCLAPSCSGFQKEGHTHNAIIRENPGGLLYICLSTNAKWYMWQREEKLARVLQFNEKHFVCYDGAQFATIKGADGVLLQSRQLFCQNYENLEPVLVPGKKGLQPMAFINYWLRHPERRTLTSVESIPPPLQWPEGVYNSWRGFAVEQFEGQFEYDEKLLDPILYHIKSVLADDDSKVYKYILD